MSVLIRLKTEIVVHGLNESASEIACESSLDWLIKPSNESRTRGRYQMEGCTYLVERCEGVEFDYAMEPAKHNRDRPQQDVNRVADEMGDEFDEFG